MGAFDKLKQVSEKPKDKKSSVREVKVESLQAACDAFVKADKALKNAEAEHKQSQEEILEVLRRTHAESIKEGNLTKSYRVNDNVLCIFTDRFSPLKGPDLEEASAKLKKANVAFDRLFKEKVELKLKANVADNEKELEKLIEALGDLLPKYFEVNVKTLPVDNFDEALSREKIYGELSDIVERVRYKPTMRVS